VRTGGVNSAVQVNQTGFYLGAPVASVPAEALPGASLSAARFTLRAWQDGDRTRAVLYAVVETGPEIREVETPIATYEFRSNSPARVYGFDTQQWSAAPVVLRPIRPLRSGCRRHKGRPDVR
jgi:hypothetical protein